MHCLNVFFFQEPALNTPWTLSRIIMGFCFKVLQNLFYHLFRILLGFFISILFGFLPVIVLDFALQLHQVALTIFCDYIVLLYKIALIFFTIILLKFYNSLLTHFLSCLEIVIENMFTYAPKIITTLHLDCTERNHPNFYRICAKYLP